VDRSSSPDRSPQRPQKVAQDAEVDKPDGEQKAGRDQSRNHTPDRLQSFDLLQRTGGQSHQQRSNEDDTRVTNGEEETDSHRALTLLHQLAGDVVDRSDVVSVNRMPQAEAIGECRRAEQQRTVMQ
jgi:hypothetical protein